MNNQKVFVSIFLCLLMLFSALPGTAMEAHFGLSDQAIMNNLELMDIRHRRVKKTWFSEENFPQSVVKILTNTSSIGSVFS